MRTVCTSLIFAASAAAAQPYMDSTKFAMTLGSLLGSETACAIDIDQSALHAYIDQNADPAELNLPNVLSMVSDATELEIEAMTETQRSAHCHMMRRSADEIGILAK